MQKTIAGKVMTFCLGMCLVLILLEAVLHVAGMGYQYFRARQESRDDNSFRILCIGDSFVEGAGAPKGKSFPSQLEEMLNQADLPRRAKVINAGRAGRNIEQIWEKFQKDIDTAHPDLVIFLGGMISNQNLYGYHAYVKDTTFKGRWTGRLYRTHTFRLVSYLMANLQEKRRSTRRITSPPEGAPVLPQAAFRELDQGQQFSAAGDYAQAIACFRRSIALYPKGNIAYYNLMHAYELAGKHAQAAECYEEGMKALCPYSASSHFTAGNIYQDRLKDVDKAFNAYRRGLDCPVGNGMYSVNYSALAHLSRKPQARHLQEQIERLLDDAMEKNEQVREAVELLYEKDFEEKIGAWKKTRINNIIDLCQQRNIPVILQDYPQPYSRLLYETIAKERSVPFVCNSAVFARLFETHPRNTYISFDNSHCNANGYRVMAENLCSVILEQGMIR